MAEFDTQPDNTEEDEELVEEPQEERRQERGFWASLALLVLVAIVILLVLTQCTARVPNTIGLTQPEAKARLKRAGLTVGDVSDLPFGAAKAGRVGEQAPVPGSIARRGSGVDLIVGSGANLTVVPDVVGMSAANASIRLMQAGFEVDSGEEYSDTVPEGLAVEQDPQAGTAAERGSIVAVYYSLGPQSAAKVRIDHNDSDDGLLDSERDSTGSGTSPLIMNCYRAYPGATAWSSGGDIYVRTSPGAAARRVTRTSDWDTNPVISPSHKYLVFLRSSGSGSRPKKLGAVCFTSWGTTMIDLPPVNFADSDPVYLGRPVFAPTAGSTRANSDWIVLPQYFRFQYWSESSSREDARLLVCNVPLGSSWVSWNEKLRPARTISLGTSGKAGCIKVTQKDGSKTTYSRNFNVTTGLYLR